ncbi:MAG: hypothetical protein JXB60_06685, partial [Candidatus Cloacimonetes bacterium]|nr:hypothetical protein [Candidatus Cloacimonadota bacterium]
LILGQFKSPFSLEQNTGCAALHTIIRAKIVDELGAPQRDIGAMIYGNPVSFAEFWVAVMNGTGRGEADDNKNKHLIGRLVVQPFAPLRIGGSCRYGTSPSAVQGNTEESKHIRYSLETQIEYAGMLFQGEYIYGRDEGINLGGG